MSRKAFTLIELICVIAILSIMAAFLLPRFVQTQKTAIEKQEDTILVALKEAINHRHMLNVLNGNDVWPGSTQDAFANGNPFELLNPKPPAINEAAFLKDSNDNVRWRYWNWTAGGAYFIYCPHWSLNANANLHTPPPAYRGRMYHYTYTYPNSGYNQPAGSWLYPNTGIFRNYLH